MAAHYRTTLALLVLGAPLSLRAQALPKHTYLVGVCESSAIEALAIFKKAAPAPQFDLYIICDSTAWHILSMKNGFPETSIAISIPHTGMIWLGPKAISTGMQLREAVDHELEHVRCDCDLGEHLLN